MNTKSMRPNVVVVGAGPVGMHVARRVVEYRPVLVLDADQNAPGATERRAQLLHLLARDDNTLDSRQDLVQSPGIECRNACRVARIDRAGRALITEQGERIEYDELVLASGASPVVPPFEGRDLSHVQTAYSRSDIRAIFHSARHKEAVVIVGGGLLAVELAASIAARACVTLVVRAQLLRAYADCEIGLRVADYLRTLGVAVEQGSEVARIVGEHRVRGVWLRNGRAFDAARVVLACGMHPNTDLADAAKLPIKEGIEVDAVMQTSDRHIFAVGDCAQPPGGCVRGDVARAIHQAERAIAVLLGRPVPLVSEKDFISERRVRLGRRDFLAMTRDAGRVEAPDDRIDWQLGKRTFSIRIETARIAGYQALLPIDEAERLAQLAQAPTAISRRMRLRLRLGLIPRPASSPDPIVCHCAGVRRSRVVQAAADHGTDVAALGRATGARCYCGGCVDALSMLVEGRRKRLSWASIAASLLVLAVVAVGVWLPLMGPGNSVTALWFRAYALLMTNGMRQATGYVSVAFIVLALGIISPRHASNPVRNRRLHVLYGTLALAVMPLHTLGGMGVGAGLNRILVAIFLICVLLGVFVLLKRSLRQALWLHSVATVVLLAAIAIHVVDIYQY